MTSGRERAEYSSRTGSTLLIARWWRNIERNGTTPRPARDQQERAAEGFLPDEIAADRATELQRVPGVELVGEIGRHFPVLEPLDGEHEVGVFGSRGDRVAALRLVTVLGGETHIDVLSGPMPVPVRQSENDALCSGRLLNGLDHRSHLPVQSPL
jgi:hypothetical protein